MSALLYVGVAAAGSVGAGARFVVDGVLQARRSTGGRWAALPLGTPLINVTGSLLLGALTGLVIFHGAPDAWRVVAGTGFCGGYTTFGTASVETVRLAQERRSGLAALTAFGTLAATLLAAAVGLALAAL